MESYVTQVVRLLWPAALVVVIYAAFKCFKNARDRKGLVVLSIVFLIIGGFVVPGMSGFHDGYTGSRSTWLMMSLMALFCIGAIGTGSCAIFLIKEKNPFITKDGE